MLEFGWWERFRPRPPVACEKTPGVEPTPHSPQRDGLGRADNRRRGCLPRARFPPTERGIGPGGLIGGPTRAGRCRWLGGFGGGRRLGESLLPAEGERTPDERLMPSDRGVGTDHEVRPAQLGLHSFMARFDQVAGTTEPDEFGQVCWGERQLVDIKRA